MGYFKWLYNNFTENRALVKEIIKFAFIVLIIPVLLMFICICLSCIFKLIGVIISIPIFVIGFLYVIYLIDGCFEKM